MDPLQSTSTHIKNIEIQEPRWLLLYSTICGFSDITFSPAVRLAPRVPHSHPVSRRDVSILTKVRHLPPYAQPIMLHNAGCPQSLGGLGLCLTHYVIIILYIIFFTYEAKKYSICNTTLWYVTNIPASSGYFSHDASVTIRFILEFLW